MSVGSVLRFATFTYLLIFGVGLTARAVSPKTEVADNLANLILGGCNTTQGDTATCSGKTGCSDSTGDKTTSSSGYETTTSTPCGGGCTYNTATASSCGT